MELFQLAPIFQVLVALRFFVSGSLLSVVGVFIELSQSSVSRIIEDVTNILFERAQNVIRMPSSSQQISRTKQDFGRKFGFPNVIGCIDGTHIPIKAPIHEEAIYVNRKNFHSLNIQAVCDSHHRFLNYCAKYPGSTHDSFIWSNSSLRQQFQHGEFGNAVLLGMLLYVYLVITYLPYQTGKPGRLV